MRYLFTLTVLLCTSACFAEDYIRCYGGGQSIYSGYVSNVAYEDRAFSFIEKDTGKQVLVTGNCVLKIDV